MLVKNVLADPTWTLNPTISRFINKCAIRWHETHEVGILEAYGIHGIHVAANNEVVLEIIHSPTNKEHEHQIFLGTVHLGTVLG